MMKKVLARFMAVAATLVAAALFPGGLLAAPPTAMTVPFVASNPSSPHTSWSGNPVTLKGTLMSASFPADTFTYDWNPGDGGAHCAGTVTNQFVIPCAHTYSGSVGTVFTAILTITDTTSGQVSPAANCPPSITQGACYYTSLNAPPPNLPVEVNNAIDNGLWYIHTEMLHTTSAGGTPIGNWYRCDGNAHRRVLRGRHWPELSLLLGVRGQRFSHHQHPCESVFSRRRAVPGGSLRSTGNASALARLPHLDLPATRPDQNGKRHRRREKWRRRELSDWHDARFAGGGWDAQCFDTGRNELGQFTAGLGSGPAKAYTYKDAIFDMVDDYSYCLNPGEAGFCRLAGGITHVRSSQGIIRSANGRRSGSFLPGEMWAQRLTHKCCFRTKVGWTRRSPARMPRMDTSATPATARSGAPSRTRLRGWFSWQ